MPRERLSMRKIKEVLRLRFEHGLSHRAIATLCRQVWLKLAEDRLRHAVLGIRSVARRRSLIVAFALH